MVVYDWKNFTLQELMRHVKKTLGGRTVWSVGVVAPGSKPGGVGEPGQAGLTDVDHIHGR